MLISRLGFLVIGLWFVSSTAMATERSLYGHLQQTDQGYRFVEFSNGPDSGSAEAWVDLARFEPMWSVDRERCFVGVVKFTSSEWNCRSQRSEHFRHKGLNSDASSWAAYGLFGLLSAGVGYFLVPGEVSFNESEFDKALAEALSHLEQPPSAIQQYAKDYVQLENDLLIEFKQLQATYDLAKKDALIDVFAQDKSGLYPQDSVDFSTRVQLRKNNLVTAQLPVYRDSKLASLVQKFNVKALSLRSSWQQDSAFFQVECENGVLEGAHYQLFCPDRVARKAGRPVVLVAEAVVSRMDFDAVLPQVFDVQDASVRLYLDGGFVQVQNLTRQFVTLETLAFSSNPEVDKFERLDIEVAPEGMVNLGRLDELPLVQKSVSFTELDQLQAQNISVEYGVSLNYQVADSGDVQVLQKTRRYNLFELLTAYKLNG